MMRSDCVLQTVAGHLTGSLNLLLENQTLCEKEAYLSCRATKESHDTSAGVGEGGLMYMNYSRRGTLRLII